MPGDDRELRDLLESTQAELRQARDRLKVLELQSTDALEDRIDALEAENEGMRARLEQGDAVRESWANRQATLERELVIARTEQQRLQSQLESLSLERKLTARPEPTLRHNLVLGIAAAAGLATLVVLLLRLLLS